MLQTRASIPRLALQRSAMFPSDEFARPTMFSLRWSEENLFGVALSINIRSLRDKSFQPVHSFLPDRNQPTKANRLRLCSTKEQQPEGSGDCHSL